LFTSLGKYSFLEVNKMKNYLIGLVTALGLTGCVALPNIDYSQQKVERFNPVKNWISVDSASVKDIPNGNEIFKLKGGSEVYVFRYQDEWALINPNSHTQQWIDTKYLCSFSGCYTPPIIFRNAKSSFNNRESIYSIQQREPKRYSNTKTRSTSTTHTSRTYSQTTNNSCYCTSGTYCVGPRGGHYCLNSTGSKRYLPR